MSDSEIKFNLFGIGSRLKNIKLFVPKYQRSYAWKKDNVEPLFKDIADAIDSKEKEFFLGSIVVVGNDNEQEIIDGQQRLATISILLAAIRDYFFREENNDAVTQINSEFLSKKDLRTGELNPHLTLNGKDHDFYLKKVLSLPNDEKRKIKPHWESHQRLLEAQKLASQCVNNIVSLTNQPTEKLLDWKDFLEHSVKVMWIKVPNYANAFIIFETLNDRGLELSKADLIKNYLFGKADERINEVQERWISMTGTIENIADEKEVINYIRYYWSSTQGVAREKELYDKIKSKKTTKQQVIDFANSLEENAEIYAAILSSEHSFWNEFGSTTKSYIKVLNDVGFNQVRPLLLSILKNFPKKEITLSLKLLISWAIRFQISGTLSSGVFETNFSQLAVEVGNKTIKKAKDLELEIVPKDTEFEEAFSTALLSNAKIARYVLHTLEEQSRSGNNEREFTSNRNEDEINLEHVLPKNPNRLKRDWSHIKSEDAKIFYNRIGNLTLLKSTPNSKIGNEGPLVKLKEYEMSDFEITQMIANKIKTTNNWTLDNIRERQKELAKLAVKAWTLKV